MAWAAEKAPVQKEATAAKIYINFTKVCIVVNPASGNQGNITNLYNKGNCILRKAQTIP